MDAPTRQTRQERPDGWETGTIAAILTAGRRRQKGLESRRARWLWGFVFIVLWGLITHGTYAGTGDEPHYQMIAHSVVFDRDIDLTGDYQNPSNRALAGRFEGGAHVQPGKDGRLRPVHDIGMPLLFAPYYLGAYKLTELIVAFVPEGWLARARLNFNVLLRHLLSFAMIGITACIAVGLLDSFSALSAAPGRAFAWALLIVLSPPILSHSFLFFTEILSAGATLAVFTWLRKSTVDARLSTIAASRARLEALLAGSVVGFLFLVHARNAGLIAGLIVLAVVQSRRWRDRGPLMAFAAGVALLFAVRVAVTYHFWGTWLTTPHARLGEIADWRTLLVESGTRLTGWLFDQEHGLLPYAPIYALVPAGWFTLWKRDRDLCAALTLVVGAYVTVMTVPVLNAHGWRGGWSPAARFLVPVAPLLAILAFAAVAHLRRLPAIVYAIVGAQVVFDAILWQYPRLLWNDGIGTSALLAFLDGATTSLTGSAPSIVPPLDARTLAAVALIATSWFVLSMWLARAGLRELRERTP